MATKESMVGIRRPLLAICLLLGLNGSTFGQSALPRAKNDSLWAVWNNASAHDTLRILAMRSIAWDGYLFTQPDSAHFYAQKQYDFAEKVNRIGGMADALNTQASAHYVKGDMDKAVILYTRSMKMRQEQGNSRAEAASLNNLGNIHQMRGDLDRAMDHYAQCHAVMDQLGDTRGMAVTLNNMADIHKERGDFVKALELYGRCMSISEETGDKQGVAQALDNMGHIHRFRGDLAKAVENYMRSLRLSEERGDSADMAGSFNHLANAHQELGEDSIALEYHARSLSISMRSGYSFGEGTSLLNMGTIYYGQGNLDEAMDFYKRSLGIRERMGDVTGMALCLNNIGNILQDRGNLAAATDHYSRSLTLNEQVGHLRGMSLSLFNLGSVSFLQGEMRKSHELGQRSLSLAQQVGDVKLTRDAALLLYRCLKATGRINEALAMHELHIAMRDSILRTDNEKTLLRQRFQYEYEKKEAVLRAEQQAKDAVAEARIRSQRIAIVAMGGGGLMLLSLGGAGFFLFRQRQRNRALTELVEARDAERNRLSRELHDGVAGDLFGLQMTLAGKSEHNGESLAEEVSRIRDEVRHVSHDLAMPDLSRSSLPELADYLIGRWRHAGKEVIIHIEPEDFSQWFVAPARALHIYRILQELLTNAFRHTDKDGTVKVALWLADGQILLTVSNPIRDDQRRYGGNGIGLKNVDERAAILRGRVNRSFNDGTAQVEVTVPL